MKKDIWTDTTPQPASPEQRTTERRDVNIPARLTWKDAHGAARFASVVTRNISEHGALVENFFL